MKEMRLYDLLGVQPGVDLAALKKSYRNLAKKFHPDKNPEGGEVFKNISMAYDILSDPEKRKVYDVSGEQGIQGGRAEEEEHRQLSATGQPLLAQPLHAKRDVFTNPVISDCVLRFLPVTDLKTMALVCRYTELYLDISKYFPVQVLERVC